MCMEYYIGIETRTWRDGIGDRESIACIPAASYPRSGCQNLVTIPFALDEVDLLSKN